MVLDFSATDKPRRIQQNLIAYMRLFAGLPGVVCVDDGSFWLIYDRGAPGSMILRASWTPDPIEPQIDALYAQIEQHTDGIDWMVFPEDRPHDLGRRLEARGMPGGPAGIWLWADLSGMTAPPAASAGFHIEQVRDDRRMALWTELSSAGFEEDESIFHLAYARHGYGQDAFSLHYIGYLDDVPVTSATLLDAGGWATIYDLSTPPAHRMQGFGGAMTRALMHETRRRGYDDTWIWSSNMAKPLYQSLGYVDADFGIREHTWTRP